MDLSLQQILLLLACVLTFAGCGWAWHVMRERGLSPWVAISHFVAVRIMESRAGEDEDEESNENLENAQATTNVALATTALQSDATYSKGLLDGQARALAVAVKAGKWGETEGIKAVFGVSPSSTNQRYIAARAALKAELEKLNNPYPYMTTEQKRAREELGLSKS